MLKNCYSGECIGESDPVNDYLALAANRWPPFHTQGSTVKVHWIIGFFFLLRTCSAIYRAIPNRRAPDSALSFRSSSRRTYCTGWEGKFVRGYHRILHLRFHQPALKLTLTLNFKQFLFHSTYHKGKTFPRNHRSRPFLKKVSRSFKAVEGVRANSDFMVSLTFDLSQLWHHCESK